MNGWEPTKWKCFASCCSISAFDRSLFLPLAFIATHNDTLQRLYSIFFRSLSSSVGSRKRTAVKYQCVCVCELCGHMVLLEYKVSPVIYIFFLRFTGMIRTKATRHNGTPNISFLRLQIFIVIISRIVAAVLVAIRPNFSPFRWETVAKFLWGKWNGTQTMALQVTRIDWTNEPNNVRV